nr:sn-glycerol-3-phosphate ABC transporter ATP-binding protein UgpC [Saccharopolyspora sp. HNM0983]
MENVTKRYPDGSAAVDGMDLHIADGEFVILVGPSGCGKSTTLNMIAGLEDITAGELRIGGTRVNERAPKDRDIAMVFQSYALYPHLTVFENMAFPLRLANRGSAEVRARVHETAELLGLADLLRRRPGNLSGGQRQRVAMGRAIVREPRAFLMDEPLSNLDAKLRVQMRGSVSRLQKRLGTTTAYVTHDQTEAMTLGDRVVVMRDGLVQQVGRPQDLYEHPANLFVAGFIGSPPMNLLPAAVEDGELRCALGRMPLTDALRRRIENAGGARELVLGVRPEHLADAALHGGAEQPEPGLTGEVDFVEELGSDRYAHLALPEFAAGSAVPHADRLVARLPADSAARTGAPLALHVDPNRLHLFDPAGDRLPG